MIDKRELLQKARDKSLNLQIVEKDYVLGWLLYGMQEFNDLVFKGGTALSKIYFPETWRLSEDLDFAFTGQDFDEIAGKIESVLSKISKESRIKFKVKNKFTNPLYFQLKIGYTAVIGMNWIKVDATKEQVMDTVNKKALTKTWSDYPTYSVNVESLEEIFSEKIRSLIERTKCRDYFDVWKLCSMKYKKDRLKELFLKKCKIKDIEFEGIEQIFPDGIKDTLSPYWERELGRLMNPLPELDVLLRELREGLRFLA